MWSVVQTEPQRETVAVRGLVQNYFQCYLPRLQTKRGGRQWVPLFPSYVFVRQAEHWHAIPRTIAVVRLLMAGSKPATLPEHIVDMLQCKEGRDGLIRLAPSKPAVGAKVRILTGQFCGHVGLYAGMSGRERERVLLELLGRAVPVELAKQDQIEAITHKHLTVSA
jgi:transcription antitermination factor NusG